jgi:ABC-type Zn uptake system ZnuABC Zn-binding protein ZnuA
MRGARRVVLLALSGLVAVGAVVGLSGCTTEKDPWDAKKAGPKVVVSFPPLYCFVKNVAGDDAQVVTLLRAQGPHEYNLSPGDVTPLQRADLFFVNGLGLEEKFAPTLVRTSGNNNLKMVALGEAVPEKERQPKDPHVWLGIPEAVLMVKRVVAELKDADKAHADGYEQRGNAFVEKLNRILKDGRDKLPGKKEDRRLVSTHDALFYFARAFDLDVVGHIRPAAEVGISPTELHDLAELVKEKKVHVVTTEPQFRDTDARQLEKEVGFKLKLVEVDPLETAGGDLDEGWYERKMRDNLEHLANAFSEQ